MEDQIKAYLVGNYPTLFSDDSVIVFEEIELSYLVEVGPEQPPLVLDKNLF